VESSHRDTVVDNITQDILSQLRNDELYYGWIRQIVRTHATNESLEEADRLFIHSVLGLLSADKVELGNYMDRDGVKAYVPWQGDLNAIEARLRTEVSIHGESPEPPWGVFWMRRRNLSLGSTG
jgi:hypothetical protein